MSITKARLGKLEAAASAGSFHTLVLVDRNEQDAREDYCRANNIEPKDESVNWLIIDLRTYPMEV